MMSCLFSLYFHEKEKHSWPSRAASLSLSVSLFHFLLLSRHTVPLLLYNSTWLMAVINEIMKPLFVFIGQCPQAAGLPNGSRECLLYPTLPRLWTGTVLNCCKMKY